MRNASVAPERSSSVLAMKMPEPEPAFLAFGAGAAAAGHVGLPMRARISEEPGPSSEIVTATSCSLQRTAISTREAAKSTAFSTRLPSP